MFALENGQKKIPTALRKQPQTSPFGGELSW